MDGDRDFDEYQQSKERPKIPLSGTASVSAMERNKQMAARAGLSSLTLEEEARVKLLLGPDLEGDELGGSITTAQEDKSDGRNSSMEHEQKGELFTEVFGGVAESKKLKEVDEKLKEMGFETGEDDDEHSASGIGARGEGVLRARAKARAEKEKERALEEALVALKSSELPLVGGGEVGPAAGSRVTEEDIKRVADEANLDLLHEDAKLADKADIRMLLDRMQTSLARQAELREQATAKRRKEIEEVIAFSKKAPDEAGNSGFPGSLDVKDLGFEPKKWANEIGDVYQSGFQGNDVIWDATDEEDDAAGEGEGKEESKSGGTKGHAEGKENSASNISFAKQENSLFNIQLELESKQAKLQVSLNRADAASNELKELKN